MPTPIPHLLRRLCVLALFGLLAPDGFALTKFSNLAYVQRDGRELKLDLYLPDTPPPAKGYPLIISFHGGGWAIGNKHNDLFLKDLVNHGYALASVDYRLSGKAKFPAQIEDAREAVHWLLREARVLHLDPQRFAATGVSAGAHLALLVAFSESHMFAKGGSKRLPRGTIKAVCAFYPPTDLVRIIPPEKRNDRDNLMALLLGAPVSERLALAREGSPMSYIEASDPPVFLVHGDKDKIVPLEQSEILARALAHEGVESRLEVYPGKKHAFRPQSKTIEHIARFLDRQLGR